MAIVGPDNLVLLFYDGYERQASPTFPATVKSLARRYARFAWKTLRRQHLRTGFYTWFLMLRNALRAEGYDVRINDFATARRYPDHPISASGYPTVFAKLEGLSNPRVVGPGIYASPLEGPTLFDDKRIVAFLSTCKWFEDMFRPFYGDRLRHWFGGFDINTFADARTHEKKFDVLIYDKIYFDREQTYARTIGPLIAQLERDGLTYRIIRYGNYSFDEYIQAVKESRSMAFFAASETQGMAYQECLALNTPIFAWDEGVWPDPRAAKLSDQPVPCTSVPYFDDRCGLRFQAANMLERWKQFRDNLRSYEPRAFIAETMTFKRSAAAYMAAYNAAKAGNRPAVAQPVVSDTRQVREKSS